MMAKLGLLETAINTKPASDSQPEKDEAISEVQSEKIKITKPRPARCKQYDCGHEDCQKAREYLEIFEQVEDVLCDDLDELKGRE